MRTKVTLVLVFLNVVLAFFIFYIHPRLVVMEDLEKARRRVLPDSLVDLQSIEIKGPDSTLRLVRQADGSGWSIAAPVAWPANAHAVAGILSQLQLLEHETDFDVAGLAKNRMTLADYGLEQPVLTVTLVPSTARAGGAAAQAAKPVQLRIGNGTHTANRLYVLSPDGKRIHVVGRGLADTLLIPMEQLRAESVFSIPSFEVRSFNIQYPPPTQRVWVQRDDARWLLESPVRARAAGAAVDLTLAGLASLRVGDFVSQAPAAELNPATASLFRITIAGNNRSETLLVGGAVPGATNLSYAQIDGRPTLFTLALPQDLGDTLRHAQERLRETRLLEFDPAGLNSIVLRNPVQGEVALQRLAAGGAGSSAAWQVVRRNGDAAPLIRPADGEAVQRLITRLAGLNALKFVNDAPDSAAREAWGFNSPERSISLQFESPTGQAASAKLEIGVGSERGPRAYARLDSADYVYQVDAEILRDTPVDARAWRDRGILSLPAGARISSLSLVELPEAKPVATVSFPSGSDLPAGTPQAADWQKLAACLRQLRAKAYALDHYADSVVALGAEHAWKYRLDVVMELSTGNGTQANRRELLLTDRVGGTIQFAGSRELDAVFELGQEAIDPLWALLHGPKP